jgi:hypothetical protein
MLSCYFAWKLINPVLTLKCQSYIHSSARMASVDVFDEMIVAGSAVVVEAAAGAGATTVVP